VIAELEYTPKSARELAGIIRRLHDFCRDSEPNYQPVTAHRQICDFLFAKRLSEEARIAFSKLAWVRSKQGPVSWYQDKYGELTARLFAGATVRPEPMRGQTILHMLDVLESYRFDSVNLDLLGNAYETVLAEQFRGFLGQFFTPRSVVDFMVKLADPKPDDYILDHAAGSGGFLIYAIEHLRNAGHIVPERITGLERSMDLARVANFNLTLHGGRAMWGRIFQVDTLQPLSVGKIKAIAITGKAVELQTNAYSLVLSNPPFGQKASIGDAEAVIGDRFSRASNVRDAEALFLVRAYDLLRNGGRVCIVLPNQILWGRAYRPFQEWICENWRIRALIRLPKETFVPFGSTMKCSILYAEKTSPATSARAFVGFARYIGYDQRGLSIHQNDLPVIVSDYRRGGSAALWRTIPLRPLHLPDPAACALEAERERIVERLRSHPRWRACEISHLLHIPRVISSNRNASEGWIIDAEHVSRETRKIFSARREQGRPAEYRRVFPGDILVLRIRPYLRKVAVVPERIKGESIDVRNQSVWAGGEFLILRKRTDIDPKDWPGEEMLWALIRSDIVLRQLLPTVTGGTRPRITPDKLLSAWIAIPPDNEAASILDRLGAFESDYADLLQQKAKLVREFKQAQAMTAATDLDPLHETDTDIMLEKADLRAKKHRHDFY
jgi:hypothetical protein